MSKKQDKDRIADIFAIGFIIILIVGFLFLFFSFIRIEYIGLDYDNICKYNYGENYVLERNNDFGTYCIELIHENLTKENPKPFDWEPKQLDEMCGVPGWFDLTKWDIERCKGEYNPWGSLSRDLIYYNSGDDALVSEGEQ